MTCGCVHNEATGEIQFCGAHTMAHRAQMKDAVRWRFEQLSRLVELWTNQANDIVDGVCITGTSMSAVSSGRFSTLYICARQLQTKLKDLGI